jgi:hypothetical protein
MVRPEPSSGRELANRRRNSTEHRQKSEVRSEDFTLCGVATVSFRVLTLFVVTKCYSYSKIVLQLIVVPPGEYPINRVI